MTYLLLTLLFLLLQGLFAMFEMACVSFNRIRLEYYATIGKRRAKWLLKLLDRPSMLFGTTLIGINASLQIGSECARRFYESMGLDPDWAPLTQVILVVIFGELAPLFAARRHPEQIAFSLTPWMALISRLLTPFIWVFDLLRRLFSASNHAEGFLSREEVQRAFGEKEENPVQHAVSQIFRLRSLHAGSLSAPLTPLLASQTSISELAAYGEHPFVLVYHNQKKNIVGWVRPRDCLRANPSQTLVDFLKTPWFIPASTPLLSLLEQFRKNKESMALLVDSSGVPTGLLSLDQVIDTIFGGGGLALQPRLFIERTLDADLSIASFNREFHARLPGAAENLGEFLKEQLGHLPVKGEVLYLAPFEFVVVETTIRGAKTILVRNTN
jgi:CBS domain containing-hemolysin-like protein